MIIGLLSDTHGYLDQAILKHFSVCDEIWHAGDIGAANVLDELVSHKPTYAVSGNIDGAEMKLRAPNEWVLQREGLTVYMNHFGGKPDRYDAHILIRLKEVKPQIFICGHSHILYAGYDKKLSFMVINPGAAGRHGFHLQRTICRLKIEHGRITGLEVIELGKRAKLSNV